MRRLGAMVIVACVALSGCGQLSVRMGQRPSMERLEGALVVGQSTRADVVKALGQPVSQGRSQLPVDPEGKVYTLWTYYYLELEMENLGAKDARALYLYVYLEEDRYQGYLWFSSLRNATGTSLLSR